MLFSSENVRLSEIGAWKIILCIWWTLVLLHFDSKNQFLKLIVGLNIKDKKQNKTWLPESNMSI